MLKGKKLKRWAIALRGLGVGGQEEKGTILGDDVIKYSEHAGLKKKFQTWRARKSVV